MVRYAPNEHVLVGVQRVCHDVQQLLGLRLEGVHLGCRTQ